MKSLTLFLFLVAVIAIASAQRSALSRVVSALTGRRSWTDLILNMIQKLINFLSRVDSRLFNYQIRQG